MRKYPILFKDLGEIILVAFKLILVIIVVTFTQIIFDIYVLLFKL